MKKLIALILGIAFMATLSTTDTSAQTKDGSVLRHVVLFKFKDDASAADVKKVEDAFRALPTKIKTIKGYEWGKNSSPEGLNQGLTHCFFLTFASDKDRDAYLVHPDHAAFGKLLGPYLDKVTVVDYWSSK